MSTVHITTSDKKTRTVRSSVHGERALGFWFYMMSDAIIFAVLFANYIVLMRGMGDGPKPNEIFELSRAAVETALLLVSSLCFGFASISALTGRKGQALGWLVVVFVLGASFLFLELREFSEMIAKGAGPTRSGFLSGFFALVGTHGLHVFFGLIGIAAIIIQILTKGLEEAVLSRLYRLGLFWHFLDVIWIGIFSFVYIAGVLS